MGGERPITGQFSRICLELKGTEEFSQDDFARYKAELAAIAKKYGAKITCSERVIIAKRPRQKRRK